MVLCLSDIPSADLSEGIYFSDLFSLKKLYVGLTGQSVETELNSEQPEVILCSHDKAFSQSESPLLV